MRGQSFQEKRAELVRLLAGLDFYRDWRISIWKIVNGQDAELDLNEVVEPSTVWLDRVDETPKQAAYWIKEVKAWYSHTASELDYFRKNGSDADHAEINQFLGDFREKVGFDLFSEAGFLESLAKKVLKSGKIANENEREYLVEVLNATDQTILQPEDVKALDAMVFEFGERK